MLSASPCRYVACGIAVLGFFVVGTLDCSPPPEGAKEGKESEAAGGGDEHKQGQQQQEQQHGEATAADQASA